MLMLLYEQKGKSKYYVTGNFSKYIPFGADRIAVSSDDKELQLLAFEKDDKTVVIAINNTKNEKSVTIPDAKGAVTVAVTDKDNDLCEKTADNHITLSPESVTTIIF